MSRVLFLLLAMVLAGLGQPRISRVGFAPRKGVAP